MKEWRREISEKHWEHNVPKSRFCFLSHEPTCQFLFYSYRSRSGGLFSQDHEFVQFVFSETRTGFHDHQCCQAVKQLRTVCDPMLTLCISLSCDVYVDLLFMCICVYVYVFVWFMLMCMCMFTCLFIVCDKFMCVFMFMFTFHVSCLCYIHRHRYNYKKNVNKTCTEPDIHTREQKNETLR